MGLDTVPQLSMAPKTHIELRFFETYVMRLFENLLERRAQQYTGGERIKKKGSSVHSIGGQNMETSGQLQQQRSVSGTADIFKFTLKYHDRSTLTSLAMLKKGCLARGRQDIATDGSRIEGSHKGWNSLQRAQPSGIEVYSGLAHDFVLRRNIRIATTDNSLKGKKAVCDNFVDSTFGSHHMRLVNHVAVLFNTLQDKQPSQVKSGLHPMNCLLLIDSGEAFGLVSSPHMASYGGLLEIKDEITSTPETDLFLQELDAHHGAAEMRWQPVVESNSDSDDETNLHVTDCQCMKPSSGLV